jgi:predicted ATPase
MKFYHRGESINPPRDATYPCVVLAANMWDDFGYKTTFSARYYSTARKNTKLGEVKILQRGELQTKISEQFSRLDESYCSLGQSLEYYETLLPLGRSIYQSILKGLNDVVFSREIAAAFTSEEGFSKSLIRFSEAEKAFNEGRALFFRIRPQVTDRKFTFKFICRVPGAESNHELNCDFSEDGTDLHRIMALIGKNGTGKTQVLAKFASAMSGWRQEQGEFIPKRPNFSKVIAISYSVFDRFDRPQETVDSFSYVYCGIRRGNQPAELNSEDALETEADALYTRKEMEEKLLAALDSVQQMKRTHQWNRVLSELLEQRITINTLRDQKGKIKKSGYSGLSSGHALLVRLMTEVIANISNESMVLFDEPEMHLHPDALSSLISAFHLLLKEFDSYAILATHSPLILQQIPSRRVRVFRREGGFPIVSRLGKESFGENLTAISNEVFDTSELHSNYQDHLRELVTRYSYQQILRLFDDRLGFNAKSFLRSLYPPASDVE